MTGQVASVAFAVPSSRSGDREYTIGDLSREFKITLRALRFYEDRGLLAPRREGLSRYYSSRDHARVSMILKAKQLGFTLTEIKELVATGSANTKSQDITLSPDLLEEQIGLLERQLADIESALVELRDMRARSLVVPYLSR